MFDLAAINHVIVALYRQGREMPLRSYQNWALDQLRSLIPFDSAWWGNAAAEPLKVHWIHLLNCNESFLADYEPYMQQDYFREALMARPGETINMSDLTTREDYLRTAMYKYVGKRYHVEWSLGTLLIEPASSLQEFLTVWRHDASNPFTECERQMKQLLMPHMAEAFRAVRLRHFLRSIDTRNKAWALADENGFIRETSSSFLSCLQDHWPKWRGNRLPDTLAECVAQGRAYDSKSMRIELVQADSLRFLQVRPKSVLDKLTGRESEIIKRYAGGETYSQIAKALTLSPATVRNHISHGFIKLGVTNKGQMASLLASRESSI